MVDVLVAGGGPAGAATATWAARAGLTVLLVDRARFPRAKACAEYLSPEAGRDLQDLGVLAEVEAAHPARLTGFRLVSDDGASVTGRFGGRYISSRAAYAIAGHAALDALASHRGRYDAVVLACFGDPGLAALKEVCRRPVIGMAEASIAMALPLGRRFALVTGGERWVPMLEEFVAAQGLCDRLASVIAVKPTGADIARDPEGALALLAAAAETAIERDRAEVVILGGAGLAGLAEPLAGRLPVPVLDSVGCAVRMAEAVAALRPRRPLAGGFAAAPLVETIGLSRPLAALLRSKG